jgi:pyruvate kinase
MTIPNAPLVHKLAKTRIVATVGPACEDAETLTQLVSRGS